MTFQTGGPSREGPVRKKPVILCLHGGGTNSTIFNIQTIRIQRHLTKFFDFLFVDAPFDSPAGPGVLPTFDGCGPFYGWIKHPRGLLLPEAKKKIENTIRGREDEIVAVMGFSQGARLGAGLLLMQQLHQNKTGDSSGLKFGIFCMGTSPPLMLEGYTEFEMDELITIPSLHFVGTEDPWYDEGLKLYHNHFDDTFSTLTEFEIGHRLPVLDEDTMKIVEGIKSLYEETTGLRLVDLS